MLTVLVLLASSSFFFGRQTAPREPGGVRRGEVGRRDGRRRRARRAGRAVRAGGQSGAAGARRCTRLEQVLPSTLAGLLARVAEKFATGLGAIRRPGRLLRRARLSFPLWLSIALGIWAVAVAFRFDDAVHRVRFC